LEDISHKLKSAEDRINAKETEIKKLQEELMKRVPSTTIINNIAKTTLKEGWLTKKGIIIPTWSRRWCTLSSADGRLYYAKTESERFLGMIVLRGAYVQQDVSKKSGKDWCFMIMSEFDKKTYFLQADTQADMESWINAVQDRIDYFSFIN